jgi:hypothetical protein
MNVSLQIRGDETAASQDFNAPVLRYSTLLQPVLELFKRGIANLVPLNFLPPFLLRQLHLYHQHFTQQMMSGVGRTWLMLTSERSQQSHQLSPVAKFLKDVLWRFASSGEHPPLPSYVSRRFGRTKECEGIPCCSHMRGGQIRKISRFGASHDRWGSTT